MTTFILSFMVLVVVMVIMAIGLIVRRKPIKGTCASLSQLSEDGECAVCGRKKDEISNCEGSSPF